MVHTEQHVASVGTVALVGQAAPHASRGNTTATVAPATVHGVRVDGTAQVARTGKCCMLPYTAHANYLIKLC